VPLERTLTIFSCGPVLGCRPVTGRAPLSLLRSYNRSFQRVAIGELLISKADSPGASTR
jgi:hypothetical protein